MSVTCSVLVLFYSRHGSTLQLAQHIARGVNSIEGCEAKLRTVAEIEQSDHAPNAPIVSLDDLEQCDGLAMGSPVWFGNMAAPLKHLWDKTTTQWIKGSLIDKPACVFTSSSSLHGGQESNLHSMMLPLLHHGMWIVGIPYSQPKLHTTQTGGTPYGASAVTEHSSRLSNDEISLAQSLGRRLGRIALNNKHCCFDDDNV
ncbi:NAD(P)H:quinone oxidoreductase [Vibrio sp.]|nr:NAD(P)H:quinone oxidoreductase [Vibrio sp.]